MKVLILVLCVIASYSFVDAINCQQAAVGCNQNCPQNKQLLVQVSPAAYYSAACNLLASSPNSCCLMSMTYSQGLNSYFENWCCQNTSPETVKANIAGVSYIVSATVGEKRSLANEGDKSTEKQPAREEQTIDAIKKELEKVYGDTFVAPDHAQKYWKKKDRLKDRESKKTPTKRFVENHKTSPPKKQVVHASTVKTSAIPANPNLHGIVSAETNKKVKTFGYFPEGILNNLPKDGVKKLMVNQNTTNSTDEYGDPFVVDTIILGDAAMSDYSFGWNLDRIDQRNLPVNGMFKPINSGNSPTAKSIHVYVVDTGVNPSHSAFDTVTVSMDYPSASAAVDCNGHGTHVASTVAGIASGVLANKYKTNPAQKYDIVIHVIKVLDCSGSGTTFDVISGLLWIYDHAQYPAIVTMSLGSSRSYNMDNVVSLLVANKGIPVIAAAGNNNQDACYVSPAAANGVFAVGSTGPSDTRSSFSNYGTCVDIYAPGEDILGAYYLSTNNYFYLSGTSMSTPQTTGSIVAFILYYQKQVSVNEAAMHGFTKFTDNMTKNVVKGSLGGSSNNFCYVGSATVDTTPPPVAPTPSSSKSLISYYYYGILLLCLITSL